MHPDMNWFGVLEHHARRTPDKPLAVFGDEVVTYGEMADAGGRAGRRAARRAASARGDVVGLLSYNCTEFLETIFAANHLGAIAMPINWRLAAPEVRYILEHSEARALVCDEALVDLADEATKGIDGDARAGLRRARRRPTGGRALADLRADADASRRACRRPATTSTG